MARLGLERTIVDRGVYDAALRRLGEANVLLPTFEELSEPSTISEPIRTRLPAIGPDDADPLNLFRVHWYNDADRTGVVRIPEHVVVPPSLTGVAAPIVLLLGDRFPMIEAHKVLAAYACLVPRIVNGQFDPSRHRAVWPSTGNYCRGGVAISRLLGCRGIAVLPEGMSAERFTWLSRWVEQESDVIRTPGSESNVKEIYDACAALEREEDYIIFNQFSEFANHLVHFVCTGKAASQVFEHLQLDLPDLRLRAFVSASGSAGTLAAGDYLKEEYGSATVAVEALECPTLSYNGYGAHNIQGIGDKHVPLIHNVMATDAVAAVSDADTDDLDLLFNDERGRSYLRERHGLSDEDCRKLGSIGISGICNLLAAIKTAKYFRLGAHDAIVTVATDGASMYASERKKTLARRFGNRLDGVACGEIFGRALAGQRVDHFQELTAVDRERIFNLGYFTWVEQQGVSLEDFDRRRERTFWRDLQELVPAWDERIRAFNRESGAIVGK